MRSFIAPVIVAAFVLAFSLQPSATAQGTTMPPAPSGADLDAKAKAFLSAVQSNSAENLFSQLAPWRQTEVGLYRARAKADKAAQWEGVEQRVKRMDPQGKLKVGNMDAYLALSAAQTFGLAFGIHRVAANPGAAGKLADEWFIVDRKIGLCESAVGSSRQQRGRGVLETGGLVALESVKGAKLTVFCATDGREWFTVDADFEELGDERVSLRMAMAWLSNDISKARNPGADARAAEGEQLLGSMKNRARVAYAKVARIPKTLVGELPEGCGVSRPELEGKYYQCRDAISVIGTKYALVAEPKDEFDPWLLFSGDAENSLNDAVKHYDSRELLDAAVKEFGAELKKDEDKRRAEAEAAWRVYRTKGNTWTYKSTTKLPGVDDMVSYMKNEVTEVTENGCKLKTTMLDKDQKEMFPGAETPIEFRMNEYAMREDNSAPKPKTTEERITVEAGTFDCIKMTHGEGDYETVTWVHKEFPGVLVKSTSKSTSMELVKFACK